MEPGSYYKALGSKGTGNSCGLPLECGQFIPRAEATYKSLKTLGKHFISKK